MEAIGTKKNDFAHKKGILLIADGLGDRPIADLGGQTPAEFAVTPTLDALCMEGMTGLVHPYQAGCACGTDWGHLSLFGYDPQGFYSGRGSLEAVRLTKNTAPAETLRRCRVRRSAYLPSQRQRKVTICARVQNASGLNAAGPVPLAIFPSAAQSAASA